jgi:ABC-type glycerol-3-phosphate transport system substrate-binding protein
MSGRHAMVCRVAALLLVAGLAGCGKAAPEPGQRTIKCWYPWGGEYAESLREVVAEFERQHPAIQVKLSFAANNLTSSQKLFLAIAAGTAPDVTFVDGQQLAEWAARGALADITQHVQRAGLSGDDFWLPRWCESMFGGRVYALPWGADPNFALAWNKRAFAEAGLDPERPPQTIAELDDFNRRLTQFDTKGRLVRMGVIPWGWFGLDNSIFSWGYAFGGDFYQDPADGQAVGRVTANHPKLVAALRWMASYAKDYDVRKVSAFQSNFVGLANNPFYLGKVAICPIHITQLRYIRRYAPTLEYGLTFMPAPPDGEYHNSWIGGWSLAIPRGVAASDEAFEFVRWMCASPEGTTALGKMDQFPAYRRSPYYDTVHGDRDLSVFYEIVRHSRHVRTLMPAQGYLMELLRRGVEEALYGGGDPQVILDGVTVKAQERLEQVMARRAKRTQADRGSSEDLREVPEQE